MKQERPQRDEQQQQQAPASDQEARVARVLTDELAAIDTPEAAEQVAEQVEQLAGGTMTGQRAEQAAAAPGRAADAVERAEADHDGTECPAAVLAETAAQAFAQTPEAPQAARAAVDVLPPDGDAPTPEARRGRALLRDAMLHRMGRLQRWDTKIFLAVNRLPHPHAANVAADTVTVITTGGWIWLLGLAAARLAGAQDSRRAFQLAVPCVLGSTSLVEWPIKSLFKRRRPFIDVVRAMVIGRRPDGWSFPSGHTAAAFAGAWIVSTVWPRRAPVFFGLASCVGFSRVYVGAHYPGDVLSGAALGMLLSETIRRPVQRVLNW
ncbi:MAG: phosphatase PAP2 family protein [Chloroflexi bacterium]|nr:phosphatase PAP2 family protein [Chloroflexota bacterium]